MLAHDVTVPDPPERIYHPGAAPLGVRTSNGLELRVLRPRDASNDLAALVASRPALLRRSGYRWPRPGFSWAENVRDLTRHEREHAANEAYTYTVLDRASRRCVGCVYLRPLRSTLAKLERDAVSGDDLRRARGALARFDGPPGPRHASDVTLWTVPELAGDGRDRSLLADLRRWLARDFGFEVVWLITNQAEVRVRRLGDDLGLATELELRSGRWRWRLQRLVGDPVSPPS